LLRDRTLPEAGVVWRKAVVLSRTGRRVSRHTGE